MKKRPSYKIFKSVVMALFLREVQTRFGTKKLGYFWAIIDPFTQIVIFSLIKIAITHSSLPGIDYPVFLASGFLTYNFFRAVMTSSMHAFNVNRALFSYRQVKPFDTVVSRFILEFLIMSMAVLVFIGFGLYFEFDLMPKNFSMVIVAVLWLSVFAFGIGLLFAVIGTFYETFIKIIEFIGTPLFFLSGLIFTVDSLPQVAQDVILYNPVIHFMEMIHGNYFLVLDTQYVDYEYMLYWTVVPLFLGLFFYIRSEKKILSQ